MWRPCAAHASLRTPQHRSVSRELCEPVEVEAQSLWDPHVIKGRSALRRLKIARVLRLLYHAMHGRRHLWSRTSKVVRTLETTVKWQSQEAQL